MFRTMVISDIHGMVNELTQLLTAVHYRPVADHLFVLGDCIDRGPHSRAVLDFFMKVAGRAGSKLVLLRGNHEDMCIKSFRGGTAYGQDALALWIANGGDATRRSLGEENPWNYITFMEQMPLYAETETFIFVHGGIDPEKPLSQNTDDDLLWGRSYALHHSGKTVVVGHVIKQEVTYYSDVNTLCVDTGAFYGACGLQGRLSLVDLTHREVYWVATGLGEPGPVYKESLIMGLA